MLLPTLIALSLAACTSMCGWMWHQSFSASGRHTTVSWALGALSIGALIATTIAAIPLIQQQLMTSVPPAPHTTFITTPWPAQQSRPRRPLFQSLKLAQDAVKKGDFELALDFTRQAEAVPHRTAREDYFIAQLLTYIHFRLQNEVAMMAAIDAQLTYPELQPSARATLLQSAAQSRFRSKDFDAALRYARDFLVMHPKDRSMRTLYVQALFLLKRYPELEPAIDALIQDESGSEIPVSWLQMRLVVEASKPDGDVRALAEELARDFPQYEAAHLMNFRQGPGH